MSNQSYREVPGSGFAPVDPDEQQRVYDKLWADRYGGGAPGQFQDAYRAELEGAGLNADDHAAASQKLGARTKQTASPMLGFGIKEGAWQDTTGPVENKSPPDAPAKPSPDQYDAARRIVEHLSPMAGKPGWNEAAQKQLDDAYDVMHRQHGVTGPTTDPGLAMPKLAGMPTGAAGEPPPKGTPDIAQRPVDSASSSPKLGGAGESPSQDTPGQPTASGGGGVSKAAMPSLFSSDTLAKTKDAQDRIAQGSKDALLHQSLGATVEEDELRDRADKVVAFDAEIQRKQADRDEWIRAKRGEYDQAMNDVRKAEIDKRSYLERNPMSGIALAFGAALGGALSARTGGPNQGLSVLMQAVDKDIDLQKYEISKKRADAEGIDNLLARNMRIFGDQKAAEIATRNQLITASQERIKQLEASTKSLVLRDNAKVLGATLEKQALDGQMQLEALQASAAMKAIQSQGAGPGAGGDYVGIPDGHGLVDLGNGMGLVAPKEEATKIRHGIHVRSEINNAIGEIAKLRRDYDNNSYFTGPGQKDAILDRIKQIVERIAQPINTDDGGGAMSKDERAAVALKLGAATSRVDPTGSVMTGIMDAQKMYGDRAFRDLPGYPSVRHRIHPTKGPLLQYTGGYSQAPKNIQFTPK